MSRSPAVPRPLTTLLTALLAAVALMLASMSVLPSAAAVEDDVTQTAQPVPVEDAASTSEPAPVEDAASTSEPAPVEDAASTSEPAPDEDAAPGTEAPAVTEAPAEVVVAAVPPVEDFEVYFTGPDSCDSSYNVWVEYTGEASTSNLRLALQEEDNGTWLTLMTQRFYEELDEEGQLHAWSGVYSEQLAEGETATFRVVVYDRSAPSEQTVLHGPTTVTGVSYTEEDCDGELPPLPEDQWTVAEAGCGAVTFTSRSDLEVVVIWMGMDEFGPEDYFFLAPGQSRTVQTTEDRIYWFSVAGVSEDEEPVEDEVYFAGEGEVEVRQDCDPVKPGGGGHQVPGKVQTDGGADGGTVALGLGLMALAGTALVRRAL